MTYDLRRLRLRASSIRVPDTHRYLLTPLGRRVACFMSKSFVRIVRPVLQRLDPVSRRLRRPPPQRLARLRQSPRCRHHRGQSRAA